MILTVLFDSVFCLSVCDCGVSVLWPGRGPQVACARVHRPLHRGGRVQGRAAHRAGEDDVLAARGAAQQDRAGLQLGVAHGATRGVGAGTAYWRPGLHAREQSGNHHRPRHLQSSLFTTGCLLLSIIDDDFSWAWQ